MADPVRPAVAQGNGQRCDAGGDPPGAGPDQARAGKEEIKKASISLPIINSYLGKMDGDFIIYGSNCARFHKDFFIKLNEINFLGTHDGNRTIKSIELSSGVKITIEEIKQIVEYIRNK